MSLNNIFLYLNGLFSSISSLHNGHLLSVSRCFNKHDKQK